jgi:hypothetical protein
MKFDLWINPHLDISVKNNEHHYELLGQPIQLTKVEQRKLNQNINTSLYVCMCIWLCVCVHTGNIPEALHQGLKPYPMPLVCIVYKHAVLHYSHYFFER